jgi:hypothetical protein
MSDLNQLLGKLYFSEHNNRPPTFLQIVGWTPNASKPDCKRQYVYVRTVPLKVNPTLSGGSWEFDNEIITQYQNEIQNQQPCQQSTTQISTAILIDSGTFLRYQSLTIPQFKKLPAD